MRGFIENNESEFWNGIGQHFANFTLDEVMQYRIKHEKIAHHIFPPYPINIPLLPEKVQNIIGKVHPNTQPALNMLLAEGFAFTNEVDPFDGGPIISADVEQLRIFKEKKRSIVFDIVSKELNSENYLVSNGRLDFRACFASLEFRKNNEIIIDSNTAMSLNVNKGDSIDYIICPSAKRG